MNKCIFHGTFAEDPVLRTDEKGVRFCSLWLVCEDRYNRAGKSYRETYLAWCEAWHTAAVAIVNQFRKGDVILVECRAREMPFVDNKGVERAVTVYRVESFE